MNKVMLIGNLTRDPEVRSTTGTNPTTVCKFGLAVNEGYGDKQKTSFLNIVTFGRQAENCERFLSKGNKVAIEGRIQTGSYEGKNGKVYTTGIIADKVEFLNTRTVEHDDGGQIRGFEVVEEDIPL